MISISIEYLSTGRVEYRPLNRTVLTWIRREAKQLEPFQACMKRNCIITRLT
jgi:hypothetical protein